MQSANRRSAVYVDGYNLYYGRLRHTAFKWLDVVTLFTNILKTQDPTASVDLVHYFSAPALARFATHGQVSMESQQAYHRALKILHPAEFALTLGSHSFERNGTLLPKVLPGRGYDRAQRARVWHLEEKQTDVNLAMAMYRDVCKGKYQQVVICSNDSDVEPVLRAIREDFAETQIGVITPVPPADDGRQPRNLSTSLSQWADWTRRHIVDDELSTAQLPLKIPTNKRPILKPGHW